MTTNLKTRCTQCGTDNEQRLHPDDLEHGERGYGTETVRCDTCDDVTVQNRRDSSVPRQSNTTEMDY